MKCSKCNDRKHVRGEDGLYRRCDCVQKRIQQAKYLRAGVPEILLNESVDKLRESAPPELVKAMQTSLSKRHLIWLVGPSTSARRGRAIAYAIKGFVDAGEDAKRTSLMDLVNAWFDRSDQAVWLREFQILPLLVVDLANDTNHKMAPQILERLYSVRAGMRAMTIFASADDIGMMGERYGHEVAARFAYGRDVKRVPLKGAGA